MAAIVQRSSAFANPTMATAMNPAISIQPNQWPPVAKNTRTTPSNALKGDMATPLSLTIKIAADAKGALDSFVALTRRLRESQVEFREAQSKVSALAKEMASTDAPTKKLRREFDAAKEAVKNRSPRPWG